MRKRAERCFLSDLVCWFVKNRQLLLHLLQPFQGELIHRCDWNEHEAEYTENLIRLSVFIFWSIWEIYFYSCHIQEVWSGPGTFDTEACNSLLVHFSVVYLCVLFAHILHHILHREKNLRCGSIMSRRGLDPVEAAADSVRTPLSATSITPFSKGTLSLVLL